MLWTLEVFAVENPIFFQTLEVLWVAFMHDIGTKMDYDNDTLKYESCNGRVCYRNILMVVSVIASNAQTQKHHMFFVTST